jgi:hypothetical protein
MERRTFVNGAARCRGGTGGEACGRRRVAAEQLPNWRYPDARVESLDKKFTYTSETARVG